MERNWNEAYETGDTPWDKGAAAPPLREFLGRRPIHGTVLVPGCGTGHDVRLLAQQGAQVTGLDLAPAGIEQARRFPRVGNEIYHCGDFLDLESGWQARFDWVVEHTCLCALPPAARSDYAASVAAALKPGGHFLGIFYREVMDYDGSGPPHPITAGDLEALFAEAFELLEAYTPAQTYPSRPFGCEEVRVMRRRA
jgi:SAM-dependent methyltransferase